MINVDAIVGFDWDHGNAFKNLKHAVEMLEAEQIFFNEPLLMLEDPFHSLNEIRYHALGKTNADRKLHVTFTLRGGGTLIRIISARDMSRNERKIYEQKD
jgi:uncharacterized protein